MSSSSSLSLSDEEVQLKIAFLNKDAKQPLRGTAYSAGLDLFTIHNYEINPGESVICDTGIALEIPPGYYGQIVPRSGMLFKHNVSAGIGTIDSDYRGEIKVLLMNHSKKMYTVDSNNAIAQIIILKHANVTHFFPMNYEELSKTKRMDKGFGSTDDK